MFETLFRREFRVGVTDMVNMHVCATEGLEIGPWGPGDRYVDAIAQA